LGYKPDITIIEDKVRDEDSLILFQEKFDFSVLENSYAKLYNPNLHSHFEGVSEKKANVSHNTL
jgi:hypothetical protein